MTILTEPKVVAALIAVCGAIVSVIVSATVATLQTKRSAKNLREELSHKFNELLFEKRIESYPGLYLPLSILGKRLREPQLKFSHFHAALDDIEEWDSKYAIFVSPSIVELLLVVRNTLFSFSDRDGNDQPTSEDSKAVFEACLRLEQALRNELGVYSVSDFHNASVARSHLHSFVYEPSKEQHENGRNA